jgi:hypothetical protein
VSRRYRYCPRLAGERVELDDARVHAVGAALVDHRALEHGVRVPAVGADGEPLEAAVAAAAGRVAVGREVGHAGAGVARHEVGRHLEAAHQVAAAVELDQRRPYSSETSRFR